MIFTIKTDGKKAVLYNSLLRATKTIDIKSTLPYLKKQLGRHEFNRIYKPIRRQKTADKEISYRIARIYGDYRFEESRVTGIQIELITGITVDLKSMTEERFISQCEITDKQERLLIHVLYSLVEKQTKVSGSYIESLDDTVIVSRFKGELKAVRASLPLTLTFGFRDNTTGQLLLFSTRTEIFEADSKSDYTIFICSILNKSKSIGEAGAAVPLQKADNNSYLTLCMTKEQCTNEYNTGVLVTKLLTPYEIAETMIELGLELSDYSYPITSRDNLDNFYWEFNGDSTPYLAVMAEDILNDGIELGTIAFKDGYINISQEYNTAQDILQLESSTAIFGPNAYTGVPYVINNGILYKVKENIENLVLCDFRGTVKEVNNHVIKLKNNYLYVFDDTLKNTTNLEKSSYYSDYYFNVILYPMDSKIAIDLCYKLSKEHRDLGIGVTNIVLPYRLWEQQNKQGLFDLLIEFMDNPHITYYFISNEKVEELLNDWSGKSKHIDLLNYLIVSFNGNDGTIRVNTIAGGEGVDKEKIIIRYERFISELLIYYFSVVMKILSYNNGEFKANSMIPVKYKLSILNKEDSTHWEHNSLIIKNSECASKQLTIWKVKQDRNNTIKLDFIDYTPDFSSVLSKLKTLAEISSKFNYCYFNTDPSRKHILAIKVREKTEIGKLLTDLSTLLYENSLPFTQIQLGILIKEVSVFAKQQGGVYISKCTPMVLNPSKWYEIAEILTKLLSELKKDR